MIKLAIFDLDGTLINSIEDLADAMNYALNELGFATHSLEKYNYFVGDGLKNLIIRAIPENERTDGNFIKVENLFSQYYSENYYKKTKIYNNIIELLNSLKLKGIKLAVASNKPDEFTKKIISKLFDKDLFDFVSGNKNGIPHKPNPQIINDLLSELKISRKNAVMIGDTNVDIFTGKNAEIHTIGCLWGFRDRAELEDAVADFIAENPLDIENALKIM